ncbi:uncharacterized protein [Aegilops tauschii subsp. strangulata]|uniref:uncharacterized protein n=1 Tax=Aegilops tauschii subsp. strangulata TaxID=200361 RepID=UPI003CC89C7B
MRPVVVCNHGISTRLLYATDAPARLPISEFIVGLPDRLTGLLLPLIFAVCIVPEFTIHIGTLWSWRLALATSFDQAHYLLSLRLSTASVLGLFALWVAFAHEYVPFAVAPFSHWVARLEARRQGFGGFDGSQILALFAVEAFLVVVMFDLALACVLVFLPFSLGRIVLWCILCSDSCNVGEVNSYTSTASVLLIGYGFIISVGVIYAGMYIFGQYLRGKRLVIAAFITSLSVSIGRALFAITRLPLAGGLKSNDLPAFVVGFGVVITSIGASRDAFAYMTKGRTHLRNLSQSLIVFFWSAIVPFLIGSLVDLLLIPSPAGPDDDVSHFYTWFLGFRSLRIWVKLAHETRDTPFLAYFIDERWSPKIVRFAAGSRSGKVRLRFFLGELFMPIATRLLPALCIPYVLAKGVFPRFGYSAATNSAVYRFAWLGTLGPCALCSAISPSYCAPNSMIRSGMSATSSGRGWKTSTKVAEDSSSLRTRIR